MYKKSFLSWSVERVDPQNPQWRYQKIIKEHLSRYKFACNFVKDKTVIDLGCGLGYGCHMIASAGAKRVYGIDISPSAISHAAENYSHPRITFVKSDVCKVPLPPHSADVITSFEVVEHVKDQSKLVQEATRLLKPNGVLIISTPNRNLSLQDNPYHHKELTQKEFMHILKSFRHIELFGQRKVSPLIGKVYKWLALNIQQSTLRHLLHFRPWENTNICPIRNSAENFFVYFVAVCQKRS